MTTTTTPTLGERLKADALLTLESRRHTVIERARRALLQRLLAVDTATMDDVRQAIDLPPGINPKVFGAVPSELTRAGIIEACGFAKTSRAEAHARPVTLWRLCNRQRAEAWLAEHPAQSEQPTWRQRTIFEAQEKGATGGNR